MWRPARQTIENPAEHPPSWSVQRGAGWRLPENTETIRFIDIDAPEAFSPKYGKELAVGLRAKASVVELLRGATVYVERSGLKDRYRRMLANLTTAGGDVRQALLNGVLVLPYKPE